MQEFDVDEVIGAIAAIEEDTFSDSWSESSIKDTMTYEYNMIFFIWGSYNDFRLCLYKSGNINILCHKESDEGNCPAQLLGYLIASEISGETELLRIAIAKAFRRYEFGTLLLKAYLDKLKVSCEEFFLEVRAGNVAARALYEKLSYKELGVRKRYYTNPVEDAVIYGINFKN